MIPILGRLTSPTPLRRAHLAAFRRAASRLAGLALVAALFVVPAAPAAAIDIESFTTPGGIETWLVEDHTVPLIAVNFAFRGAGSSQDPDDKLGLAELLTTLLDEGAGDLDSEAFQTRLEEEAVRLRFDAGRDHLRGSMNTISTNADAGFELLRLALTEPRFDAEAVERMRAQLVTQIRGGDRDPGTVAGRLWSRTAFPDHPYGRPTTGTEETVAAIAPADLAEFHERAFARDRLLVVVVGAIDAETLGGHLDAAFGPLPASGALTQVADTSPVTGAVVRETLEVPQTAIQFGLPGLNRHDPDFIPGFVMNHILGGGMFQSWLYQEVREKRGLVYGIYSFLVPYDHAAIFGGATSTRTDQAEEALAVILGQLERMADPGPTEEELEKAKDYLIGSYALRFDSSGSIAGQLLGIRLDDLGIDYVAKRNGLIRAVTLEDVRRVAARLLGAGKPTIATVGAGGA